MIKCYNEHYFLHFVGYSGILKNAMTKVKRDAKGGFYFNDLISILKSQIIGGVVSIRRSNNGKFNININGEIAEVDVLGRLQNIREDEVEEINHAKQQDIEISKNGKTLKFKNIDFQKTNSNYKSHLVEMTKITKAPSVFVSIKGDVESFNINNKSISLPKHVHVTMPGDTSLHSIILDISRDGKINVVDNGWCMAMARRAFIASGKKVDDNEKFLRKFLPSLCEAIDYVERFTSKKLSYKDITFSRTSLDVSNVKVSPDNAHVFPIKDKGNCLWHSFTTLMNGNVKYKPYKISQLDSSALETSNIDLFKTYEKMHLHYKGRVNETDINEKIDQIGTSYAIGEIKNNLLYDQYKIGNEYKPYSQYYDIGKSYNQKLNHAKLDVGNSPEIEKSYVNKLQQAKFDTKLESFRKD